MSGEKGRNGKVGYEGLDGDGHSSSLEKEYAF